MFVRVSLLCCLLSLMATSAALRLRPPPPLTTAGGEVIFLLFSLDNPEAAAEVTLEPQFPEGFRLLSGTERQVRPGANLLPLSVEVAGAVAAGDYQLCLRLQGVLGGACASVTVSPRDGLVVDVPGEVYGGGLGLRLANGGNEARTLLVRGEGEVRFEPVTVHLAPGDTRTLELSLSGTGDLRLFVGDRLVMVRVRSLDGRPPDKQLELQAQAVYDPLHGEAQPALTLQGDLSDYARVSGRLWPEPSLRLDWAPLSVSGGRLAAPYDAWGLSARYGEPWGFELGAGADEGRAVFGAGLVYDGASPGHVRLLYDGRLSAEGSVSDLALGGWRLGAAVDGAGAGAEVNQPAHKLGFGAHYAYSGALELYAGFGEGEARGRLSYEHGAEDRLQLSLDSGPVNWTIAGVWQPFRVDWWAGFHEGLGPGRYGLQVGVREGAPLVGGSYALNVPWLPGLSAAAALQYAGAWHAGGALSYQSAPWSASLTYAAGEAGLEFSYAGEAFDLGLEAALGAEPRLSLSASTELAWALPEEAVAVFGGRSWARLEGRVRLEDGRGLEGIVLDAGGRRVRSGPGGRYELWLPSGPATLRLLPGDAPQHAILPQPLDLVLARAERRELDLVLHPAGALRLACTGAAPGTAAGLDLFGPEASSLVACGQTIGGLPAGTYRLEPFGLEPDMVAAHPATVEIVAGETAALTLELTPRPPPEISRPALILRAPSLLVAAPGESLVLEVESNAGLVYATLPSGARRPLEQVAPGRLRLALQVPFGYAEPLFRVRLSAVAAGERLERATLIRIDPRRPLFETRLEPARAAVGDSVSVSVETRFTPQAVRLLGPGLELELAPAGPGRYQARFQVPAGWQGQDDVALTLVLEGPKRLEETYRFRVGGDSTE